MGYGAVPASSSSSRPNSGSSGVSIATENKKFEPVTPELMWDVSGFSIDDTHTHPLQCQRGGLHEALRPGRKNLRARRAPQAPRGRPRLRWDDHARRTLHHIRHRDRHGAALELGLRLEERDPHAVGHAEFTGGEHQGVPCRHARVLPGARRHEDPDVRAAPEELPPALPPSSWHSTAGPRAGPARLQSLRSNAGGRRLYLRGAQRARQRRLRQDLLDADNGPKRLDIITRISKTAPPSSVRPGPRTARRPRSASWAAAMAAMPPLMAMTMFGGTYDAGVSIVGISNLLTFLNNTAPYRRILRISEYGDPEKDTEALIKLSATTYIDRPAGAPPHRARRQRPARARERGRSDV